MCDRNKDNARLVPQPDFGIITVAARTHKSLPPRGIGPAVRATVDRGATPAVDITFGDSYFTSSNITSLGMSDRPVSPVVGLRPHPDETDLTLLGDISDWVYSGVGRLLADRGIGFEWSGDRKKLILPAGQIGELVVPATIAGQEDQVFPVDGLYVARAALKAASAVHGTLTKSQNEAVELSTGDPMIEDHRSPAGYR